MRHYPGLAATNPGRSSAALGRQSFQSRSQRSTRRMPPNGVGRGQRAGVLFPRADRANHTEMKRRDAARLDFTSTDLACLTRRKTSTNARSADRDSLTTARYSAICTAASVPITRCHPSPSDLIGSSTVETEALWHMTAGAGDPKAQFSRSAVLLEPLVGNSLRCSQVLDPPVGPCLGYGPIWPVL